MTTEHEKVAGDETVSAAYRDLAKERAPEHLNRVVLDMASGAAGRSRLSAGFDRWFAAWTRPLAWAATIGLCIAIVLEYEQESAPLERLERAPVTETAHETTGTADIELPQPRAMPSKLEAEPVAEQSAEQSAEQTAPFEAKQDSAGRIDQPVVKPKSNGDAFAASAPAASLPPAQRRQAAAVANDSLAEQALLQDVAAASACNDDLRSAPDTWLACILALRESGLDTAADSEYDAFSLQFPAEARDFEARK